jgi:hypothetical protein
MSRIARVVHVGFWRWRLTCIKNTESTTVRTFRFKTNAVVAALDFLETAIISEKISDYRT